MNRFRTKKKHREDGDSEALTLPSFTGKPFRKKKNQIESKSEIDLSTALPSADDFRTSLLMPNLSARFSMLREQDDPTTKIGKANDDSVLFPRRVSRLNLFQHNPLTDIAEVSSLSGSARPSLNLARTSYTSGEATPSEEDNPNSVLSRPRPVEGNNLFGGRQKVYKIPVKNSSTGDSDSMERGSSGSMGGKAIYENDMPMSTFQKIKEKERMEREESPDLHGVAKQLEDEILSQLPGEHGTPPPNANDSQPVIPEHGSASSTPIKHNFPGLDRSGTKTRRLYGQGLELQNQQSSALDRIESLSRRPKVPDPTQITRSLSKSAANLNEKYQKLSPVYASSNFRPNSPPLSASSISGNELSRKAGPASGAGSGQGYPGVAPLSPPLSESGEVSPLAAALQPEDRGKATAAGLFNKPSHKYDESQFQQRQVQMFEGRNTSPFRRPSPSCGGSEVERGGRSRGLSTTSYRSRAESAASAYGDSQDGRPPRSTPSLRRASPPRMGNGTFLANFSESEAGSDAEAEVCPKSNVVASAPKLDGTHASLRSSTASSDSAMYSQPSRSYSTQSELKHSESRDLKTINEIETADPSLSLGGGEEVKKSRDSPTLGPSETGGLSGLIRMHLRHDSDKSSIFPPPSPGLPPSSFDNHRAHNPSLQAARESSHSASIHSNPWELDDWGKPSQTPERSNHSPPRLSQHPDQQPSQQQGGFSMMSLRAKQMLDQANALSNQGHSPDPVIKGTDHRSSGPQASWQEELHQGHRRGGSSETQMEREELAHELAERRRRVQEKLKSFVETEGSRSTSPTSGGFRDIGPAKPGNAFAMMKNKSSRTNGMHDVPHPKPLKVLGMESTAHSASAPNLVSKGEPWPDEEERMLRDYGRQPRNSSPHIGARHGRPRQPQAPPPLRESQDESRNTFRDGPSAPWRHPRDVRDRSTSDASGRSKSRPRYREDLDNFGRGVDSPQHRSAGEENKPYRGPPSGPSSTRPSAENERLPSDRSGSSMGGRLRSNSRPVPPSFPDARIPHPVQTGQALGIGSSPRPSPVTPYSANATPPLYETSPPNISMAASNAYGGGSAPNQNAQWNQSLGAHKRVIDKSQISEPKFVSSTSNVPTVGLPPGASLSNGSSTPPVPPMNPRRRRPTATQTILGAFKGSSDRLDASTMPGSSSKFPEEQSTFSDEDKRSRPRQRLRKISSEGGNLNAKARQQAMMAKSPAMPQVPAQVGGPMEGERSCWKKVG
ncbi:hypothetical protein D8B26_003748 [Coccidioides posadasii str. Silveira]|uniref:uncharacterized protein n=1 Tax=Coccidioides posadasii (strain RMSCC 757 / Silveira) TaxID=443226 RepID=UPI001BF0316F|nr:hypothetical protein D8B26_003748 [Coccidioides posadasii str. Silveira]